MPRTFVIAEAGSNHAGSLDNCRRLATCARQCGADAVKFQFCSNYERLRLRRGLTENVYPFSIQQHWLEPLAAYCAVIGIEFMCSTFLPEDIDKIDPYLKRFKISAFEARDREFIDAHRRYQKPLLISSNERFPASWEWTDAVLHCVSEYPCPDAKINLWHMRNWGHYIKGLSDHTKHLLTGAIAVGAGATYIETHFRLYDTPKACPDYEVARTPDELAAYIINIRQAEILMYG